MALSQFQLGIYLSADSSKGFVNLYTKLTASDNIDTTSYVGSVYNNKANGINFGQVIGWRSAKNLVKVKLRVPIEQGIFTTVTEVWCDATQVSVYAPALDEKVAKFYYCTGNGVRLRNSPSLANLLNVVGAANKGDLLGKSDGFIDNDFYLIYATTLSGAYKLDSSGKKISYYVHRDYVSTVNPTVKPSSDPSSPVDTNKPAEGNTSPTIDLENPTPAANSVGVWAALGLSSLAFGVAVVSYVRKKTKRTKKP